MTQRMRWLDRITNSMDVNLRKLQVTVKGRRAWCAAVHGVTNNQTWLSDWTTVYVTHSLFLDMCELKRGLQKGTFILTLTKHDFISKGIFAEVIKRKIWHKVMLDNGKPWSKTSVLTGAKREKTNQKRIHMAEGHVKSETERGVWQLQPKEPLEPPTSYRKKEGLI